jgi:hypothetical protein
LKTGSAGRTWISSDEQAPGHALETNACRTTYTFLCSAKRTFDPTPYCANSKPTLETPPFSFFGESQCDGDGNMYFQMSYSTAEIFELSKDGHNGTFLRPTGEAKGYYQSGESYDVCMTGEQELVFLSGNQNKQKIVMSRIW